MNSPLARIESLYEQHAADLRSWLGRRVTAGEPADDLVQDTFVQALRGLDRLEQATSPRAWLFGIARNLAHAAQRRFRPTQPLPPQVPAAALPAEDEELARMRTEIAALPDALREVLELRVGADLSYEEIAEICGVPLGTVRSRLHNAVRRLRDRMETSP